MARPFVASDRFSVGPFRFIPSCFRLKSRRPAGDAADFALSHNATQQAAELLLGDIVTLEGEKAAKR
jgi:hypothetical protein